MVSASQISYIEDNTADNLNFLGICFGNKKCQETKAQKKIIKAQAKADTKVERAKRNTERALILAEKGIDNSWAGFGKGLISGFSSLLGSATGGKVGGLLNTGEGSDPIYQGGYPTDNGVVPETNTALFVGLVLGGVAIIGLVIWAIVKKK